MLHKLLPANEHTIERVIRVIVGLALLSLLFKTAWGLLGLIPLVTGLVGSCPIYTLLGFSTRQLPNQRGISSGATSSH